MTDRRSLWFPLLLAAGAAPGLPAGGRAALPERLGPYRIVEELGAGGMGMVFRAEQTAPVRREVALKLVRDDLCVDDAASAVATRDQLHRRLRLERQMLALIDHEHVVRLFDAGETPAGDPWFAMELVRGVPITDFCDLARLDLDARLDLFDEVCRTVEHLHARHVEHRDLKPDNVLVADRDGRAVPKLVDFGLATLSGRCLVVDGAAGTPTHMAPEQFHLDGADVDRRADVHALGVMLYQLLIGALPYPPATQHLAACPAPPGTRLGDADVDADRVAADRGTDRRGLSRRLRAGIDDIAVAAVHPRREQRLPSVTALRARLAEVRRRRGWWVPRGFLPSFRRR